MARPPAPPKARSKGRSKPRVQAPTPRPATGRGLNQRRYVIIAAVAFLAIGGLIAASILSTRDSGSPSPGGGDVTAGTALPGAPDVNRLLKGIPQAGAVLGRPDAPVTLVEYVDPQCPFCAQFATQAFPDLVSQYVRTGDVRMEFRGIPIIGPDSVGGLEAIYAAGEQDRLWNMSELTFMNQGTENTGWLDEDFVRAAAGSIPGLDVDRLMTERSSDAVSRQLEQAASQARTAGVSGTPTFQVGKSGAALGEPFNVRADSIDDLASHIDPLLGR